MEPIFVEGNIRADCPDYGVSSTLEPQQRAHSSQVLPVGSASAAGAAGSSIGL